MKSEFDLSLLLYAFAVSRLQHSLTVPLAVLSRPSALWVPEMLCPLCRQALRTGSQNVYSLYSLYSYHFAFRIKLRFERQIGREVWVDDAGVALMHEWSQPLNQNTVLWGDSVDIFILHSAPEELLRRGIDICDVMGDATYSACKR